SGVQSTSTLFVLPVPCGRLTVPRIAWSAFLGSTPKRRCISTELSNFVAFTSLTRAEASLSEYTLLLSILVFETFLFLVIAIFFQFLEVKINFPMVLYHQQ